MDDSGRIPAQVADYGRERDRLLDRISAILESDDRVRAAWLEGSFGRGEADEWSDLDLHIAVADDHLVAFLKERPTLYARAGNPILIQQEMTANAAEGAVFQLVLYEGIFEVDWVVGPLGSAVLPATYRMLFERSPIPVGVFPSLAADERREKANRWLVFFWAMAPIAVKYVGRSETRRAVSQIDLLTNAFIALWRLAHQPDGPDPFLPASNRPLEDDLDQQLPRLGEQISPLAALDVIRNLCKAVELLHPLLADVGASVNPAMPDQVARIGQFAEAATRHPHRAYRKFR